MKVWLIFSSLSLLVLDSWFAAVEQSPSSPLAGVPQVLSSLLILAAAAISIRKAGRLTVLLLLTIVLLMFAGLRSWQAGLPAIEVAASGVGLLLFPCALIACLGVSKKESQTALWLILLLGVLQVPFLIANHFGYLTSRLGYDQYEGLYFARGPYLSTYTIAIALLVFLVVAKRVWASIIGVGILSLLVYVTDNMTLFSLMGVSIGGYLATSVWTRRRSHILAVKTLATAMAFVIPASLGVVLSFESPRGAWKPPLVGSSLTFTNEAISRVADGVSGVSNDSVNSLKEVVAAAVAPQGPFYEGSFTNFLLGRGLGLGTSHHAIEGAKSTQDISRDFPSSAIKTSNPSASIAYGPGSTIFAWLSEVGLLGLFMILLLLFQTAKRHTIKSDPRYVNAILFPSLLLFAITPVLESPALPALLALAFMAIGRAGDSPFESFGSRRALLPNRRYNM